MVAPAFAIAASMPQTLWAWRLSITTMSPRPHQVRRGGPRPVKVAHAPAIFDGQIAADRPAELLISRRREVDYRSVTKT